VNEEKGATPATLAGFFPVGYRVDESVERATIEFYLERADDYIGSPMLPALYGVWAARIGERATAMRLLEEGYAAYVSDRFMNTHEYREDKFPEQPVSGPFMANLGGFLTGCMYGLPGIHLGACDPGSWCERPVAMPAGWDGVEVERIWVRGKEARLTAMHGDERAKIEFCGANG